MDLPTLKELLVALCKGASVIQVYKWLGNFLWISREGRVVGINSVSLNVKKRGLTPTKPGASTGAQSRNG